MKAPIAIAKKSKLNDAIDISQPIGPNSQATSCTVDQLVIMAVLLTVCEILSRIEVEYLHFRHRRRCLVNFGGKTYLSENICMTNLITPRALFSPTYLLNLVHLEIALLDPPTPKTPP